MTASVTSERHYAPAPRSTAPVAARRGRLPQLGARRDDVINAGSVCEQEAKEAYPEACESPHPYIRIVPQPTPGA